ncbi:hypothetical protein BYT27DRAFT_7223537 [Phlegmacium glaucopus]|nr:hypothetical protein BYT27DRAFT_7223537 [Phlegmacium glaucopus]
MTSTLTQAQQGPLHFLAHVICATDTPTSSRNSTPMSPADLPCCHVPSVPRTPFQGVASLHIPCKKTEAISDTEKRPLKRSNSSNQLSNVDPQFVPFIRHKLGGKTRKNAELHVKSRMQMKVKRQELLQKATKIKSLDNSPANEHQLLVLRMVFDEITMYPCESWMVLIAIIIRRAYKQVKNWFSNERQKNRSGESATFETADGDRVRIRMSALSTCQEWSDSFIEEVLMIYNFRLLRISRFSDDE